jgi:phosphoglycolate phosphatase
VSAALLWDIDGTLLSTARAGVFALEDAAKALFGIERDLQQMKTAGMTDPEIAMVIIAEAGEEPTRERVNEFLRAYEAALPERLHMRKGRVLPGVLAILEATHDREDVHNLLLTGNTRAGARAKLAHYGIAQFFDGGAFSDELFDRNEIARAAYRLAQERLGRDCSPERVFVIGDTPKDIECARAVGVRCVAVGGTYALDVLRAEDPWLALEELPPPERFAELLELN